MNEAGGDIVGLDGEEPAEVSTSDNEYEMGPGTVNHLGENEDIVFGNPNIPTSGFKDFVETICELIGAALEIPKDILLKNFNSSYSASRGACSMPGKHSRCAGSGLSTDFASRYTSSG